MSQLTPTQKVDTVLTFLYINSQFQHKIKGVTQGIPAIEQTENHKILDKLVLDGFADMREIKYFEPIRNDDYTVRASDYTYIITWAGMLFHEAGGYQEKLRIDRFNQERLETDERLRRRNERYTVIGVTWTAIGTVGLLLWEVGKAIHNLICP